MTSVSLLATFSIPVVSEFHSDTGLMKDSSHSYPLWKSNFFILKREKRDAALLGCLSTIPILLYSVEHLGQYFIYVVKKYISFFFSFKYCNHWTVKMRTEIKIIFFLWLKDGRIFYSFCYSSIFFLGEIQLPVVLSVISKIVETRAGLMPNRNDYGTVLTFGFAEIPCLNLRCQSRFKVLSY